MIVMTGRFRDLWVIYIARSMGEDTEDRRLGAINTGLVLSESRIPTFAPDPGLTQPAAASLVAQDISTEPRRGV